MFPSEEEKVREEGRFHAKFMLRNDVHMAKN